MTETITTRDKRYTPKVYTEGSKIIKLYEFDQKMMLELHKCKLRVIDKNTNISEIPQEIISIDIYLKEWSDGSWGKYITEIKDGTVFDVIKLQIVYLKPSAIYWARALIDTALNNKMI